MNVKRPGRRVARSRTGFGIDKTSAEERSEGAALPMPLIELSPEEGFALFDRQARRSLQMDGHEFLRRWEAGEFADDADRPEVMRVVQLLPFARAR